MVVFFTETDFLVVVVVVGFTVVFLIGLVVMTVVGTLMVESRVVVFEIVALGLVIVFLEVVVALTTLTTPEQAFEMTSRR